MEEITYSMLSIWYSHVAAVSTSTEQLITVFFGIYMHIKEFPGVLFQHISMRDLVNCCVQMVHAVLRLWFDSVAAVMPA